MSKRTRKRKLEGDNDAEIKEYTDIMSDEYRDEMATMWEVRILFNTNLWFFSILSWKLKCGTKINNFNVSDTANLSLFAHIEGSSSHPALVDVRDGENARYATSIETAGQHNDLFAEV